MTVNPSPYTAFEKFLEPAELARAHELIGSRACAFEQSGVVNPRADAGDEYKRYRSSRVLYDLEDLHGTMEAKLFGVFPTILHRLNLPPFKIRNVELQLTSSGDNDFFRAHTDTGHDPINSRVVTFVLFCHREPRVFSGGELRLFGRDTAMGAHDIDVVTALTPAQNQLVLFPSDQLHEVTTVRCPSDDILDTRLTLNGWLHR